MIITGNLFASLQGKSHGRQAVIDRDDKIPGLRERVGVAHFGGESVVPFSDAGGGSAPSDPVSRARGLVRRNCSS